MTEKISLPVLPACALAVARADSSAEITSVTGTTRLVLYVPGAMTEVSITLMKPVVSVEL
ncbi:hypothetical protein P7J26_01390 [Streptococcus suis]|uniref:hypothetical protein n=1 Tax=Streptococcus suis TaxID=1307 RepID=UPI0024A77682|nr:hypothetical protein [Streptococcus suis]